MQIQSITFTAPTLHITRITFEAPAPLAVQAITFEDAPAELQQLESMMGYEDLQDAR